MKTIATARARPRTIGALASIAFLVLAASVISSQRSDPHHGRKDAAGINGESTDRRHAGGIELAAAPATPTTSVADDTLTVTGSDASERIALRLAPGLPTTLQVDFGDDGSADQQFDRGTFSRVVVRAGGGSDRIRVDDTTGAFTDELVTLDGGGGDDVIDGGLGADGLLGGTGNDIVDGGDRNDAVDLGGGRDTFIWNPGDDNDTIQGQAGSDTLDFRGSNVAESLRLSPVGAHARLTRNVTSVLLDLDTVEQVNLRTLGGADTIVIDEMSATAVGGVTLDLSDQAGGGDAQVDTVTASVIVDGAQAGVAAVEGRLELQGVRTAIAIAGAESRDLFEVTARGGSEADVADIMGVELTLTRSGFRTGG
jgi:Ca2+-binding RTX toxin-like protein